MSISSRIRSIEWPSFLQCPPRLRAEMWLVVIVAASIVVIVLVSVVRSGSSFDRAAAVTRAVDASAGRLTQAQAECYVDGVHAQLGSRYLAADVSIPDDVAARMTSIRVDCVGVANLGVTSTLDPALDPSGTAAPSTEAGNLPRQHGDDPTLDALYDQCALGSGQACDDLFDRSPVGSAYETFAITCGNRTTERRCADVYVLPESTTSPPAPPVPAP
ncbi:MAG: hypothetical protein ACXV5S_09655 [Acidimicrobiales bacterium]